MDSNTFDGEMLGQSQRAKAGADRPPTVETRYPHAALPSTSAAAKSSAAKSSAAKPSAGPSSTSTKWAQAVDSAASPISSPSTGRLRAALLIVFAIVALSAFAAIGWLQYQANDGPHDPQIEIGAPDRSVPALADTSGRS